MNDLIKIENREGRETVNARELYEFLEVRKDFTNWIKDQIKRARLLENADFVVFAEKGVNGGRPKTEYHLTLEAGKHIGMLSGTENGFKVRDYFLECEKKTKQVPALSEMEMIAKIAQANVEQQKQLKAVNNRMDVLEAKTLTTDVSYFTVIGYCSLHRVQVTSKQAADLGRKCAKLSREKDYTIETVPDARFGRVNIYHTDILQEIVC